MSTDLDIDAKYLSQIINCHRFPSLELLINICSYLGCELTDVLVIKERT